MMSNRQLHACILFVIAYGLHAFSIKPLSAQPNQLPPGFDIINTEDGLSQGFIGAIFQDSKGFMWFGTRDGLNRYDGYDFKIYRHNPFDSTTISGNWVWAIYEDAFGNLWVGTSTGLNFFDPRTETFVRVPSAPEHPEGLYDNDVVSIVAAQAAPADSVLVLWVGTGKALNRLVLPLPISPESLADELRRNLAEVINHVSLPTAKGAAAKNLRANRLLCDRANHLWIAARGELYRMPARSTGSLQLEKMTERIRTVRNARDLNITQDEHGAVWAVTEIGLARIEAGDSSLQNVRYDKNTDAIARLALQVPDNFKINGLTIDTEGRIWMAHSEGVHIFDPATQTFEYLAKKLANRMEQPERFNKALFATRNGVVWIGSSGFGLLKYDLKKERFHTLTRANVIGGYSKTLYIGQLGQTPEGDVLVNQRFRVAQERDALVPYREARVKDAEAILHASSGDVWIATKWEHYYLPHGQHQPVKIFNDPERESRLFVVADNGLWFINSKWDNAFALRGAQLYHHHPASGAITSYPIILPPSASDVFGIKSGTLDVQGRLWVAAQNGLLCIDPAANKTKVYRSDPNNLQSLNQNFVKSILVDPILPERYLWIGTEGGGLNRLDLTNETFVHYLEDDGLPSSTVYGALADDRGDLWMSTNRGISKAVLDLGSRELIRFRNYFARDGLQGDEFNTNAFLKNAKGEMFFGGVNGLTWFHPDSVRDNPTPPRVVITGFYLHGKPVSHKAPGSPLQNAIETVDEIVLPYHDNVLAFEFAALDFSSPGNNLYSFKMDNYDADWTVPHSGRRTTYSQMPPGKYVFRVRGSNSDGVWNEQGAAIQLTILPPWWRTWWAYGFYMFLLGFALYAFRRYEKNRQRLKHEAALQRVEAEKLQEVDHLKSRFFANISHEFRTPLTLIMGQIESLQSEEAEARKKGMLAMAGRNAGRLLTLINQLLDLSKFEAGQMTLRAVEQNVVPLLRQIIGSFDSWAAQKKIALQFETSHDEILLWYEQDKIEKVMYNLLSNALKFAPEGGSVKVAVALEEPTPGPSLEGNRKSPLQGGDLGVGSVASSNQPPDKQLNTKYNLLITVRDSGIGIPSDRLPHIFDRFFQVDSSQTREYEGTGIGLALTQELVQIHGGGISVQSSEGFGTTFVVSLPLGKDHLKPEQVVEEAVSSQLSAFSGQLPEPGAQFPAPGAQQQAVSSDFILIVEDNADMRAFIGESLQEKYRIIEAVNGEDGFEKAQEYIPDLIITDAMMPRVDGYEMTRRIRQDQATCHIPIIMLTAKAEDEDKFAGLEQGVDAYLTKPFNKKELRIRVRKLIELRRQLRQQTGTKAVLTPSEIEASSMDQEFLQRVQECIEKNMEDENFSVDDLAGQIGMGKRQLQRKLKALTDSSPQQCIRTMRLQRARQLLERGAGTISEIALQVGYSEGSALARAFREEFGFAPSEVKSSKEK